MNATPQLYSYMQGKWVLVFVLLIPLLCVAYQRYHSRTGLKSPISNKHRTQKPRRSRKSKNSRPEPVSISPRTIQPVDAFLVLDVEATCQRGSDLSFPNEIIEFPICLLRWKDRTSDGGASSLEIVAEFRSFVKPSWRPTLTEFCKQLTGITQEQVDSAPSFPEALYHCRRFLAENGLIDHDTGRSLVRFCWCSDGPFDVRDFIVKQCFISKISLPTWLQGDVLDVRMAVTEWLTRRASKVSTRVSGVRRRSLNISAQLKALALSEFEGRQHCGIDDSRNISRILIELARRGVPLIPNTAISPSKRWYWMGKLGQILYHP